MHKLNRMLLAALFIGLSGPMSAAAQSAEEMDQRLDYLYGEHAPYRAFFDKLKEALAADDKETVASMVDYPFTARINDDAVTIDNEKHFVEDYDDVITPQVKEAVSKQTYADLFANWQGVMIGDGEVWFNGICSDDTCEEVTIWITAIND